MPSAADAGPIVKTSWFDLFKYPRSLIVSWLGNAGAQTGVYGITLWAPALFVLLLKVTPQEAAKMMILLSITGFLAASRSPGSRNCWDGASPAACSASAPAR